MVSAIFICCPHVRLGNVVKKHGQAQHLILLYVQKAVKNVLSYVIAMVRSILRCLHTAVKFQEKFPGNTSFIGDPQVIRMWRNKKLHQLHLDSFRAHMLQIRSQNCQPISCIFLQGKAELGRKTDCTHDSQSILCKTLQRIPHAADHFFLQVLLASKQIHKAFLRIIGHCIDGKIPAL